MVKVIVRIESFCIFLTGLALFHNFSDNWLLFVLFILVPDISMVGYLINKRIGTIIYNLVHNYVLPLILIFLGLVTQQVFLMMASSILLTHVGMDRFFGFGLKYKEDFKKTHIQKL